MKITFKKLTRLFAEASHAFASKSVKADIDLEQVLESIKIQAEQVQRNVR